MTPENRIPELDFARGFCILGMIAIHFVYDLTELYPVFSSYPPCFLLIKNWGSVLFFLISGICVTLGRRHRRRGSIILLCGCAVSAVTALTGLMPVRFGVLHGLGASMLCWEIFRKATAKTLLFCAVAFAAFGRLFGSVTVSPPWLYPLGLTSADFQSADFFPLFPYLGYFLAGAFLGKTCYTDCRGLLPDHFFSSCLSRFFCLCGRHSLILYLIHQPVLILFIEAALSTGGIFHEIPYGI